MQKLSTLADDLWPYLVGKVARVNRNGGGGRVNTGTGGSSGSETLAGLTDVDLGALSDGQLLAYEGSTNKWQNVDPAAGGGLTYTAGNGIAISGGNVISTKHQSAGGIRADSNGLYIVLNSESGLGLDSNGLRVGAGSGIDVQGDLTAVHLGVTSGLTFDGVGGLVVAATLAGAGLGLSAGVMSVNVSEGIETIGDNIRVDEDYSFIWEASHRFNADPQVYADLDFMGGNRNITGSNTLHIQPATDLYLDPGGNVVLPDDQVARTPTFNQFIAGIDGWTIAWLGGYKHQLSISNILVDNLFAHKFTADEARVQRGEWFLTRSYGVVETAFTVPAVGVNVDVWFEEAPGLGNAKLFLPNNWVEFRTIDWGVGLVIQTVWFQVVDAGATDYVQRQAATTTVPARQQWRLKRMAGGFTGATIAKGEVGADFGLPTTSMPPGEMGQGVIYASSLYEPDFGPFIEVQVFDSIAGGYPHFENKVRMGNLQTTVDYTAPAWGFAAADDLSVLPSAGMSGFAVDASLGARFFNTDITLYASDGIPVLELTRDHGLAMRFDDAAFADPVRWIGWYDDLSALGAVVVGIAGTTIVSGGATRRTMILETSDAVNEAMVDIHAAGHSGVSALLLLSNGRKVDNTLGATALFTGAQLIAEGGLVVGVFQTDGSNARPIDPSPLTVVSNASLSDRRVGATIMQLNNLGDSVLHWNLRAYTATGDVFVSERWYSAGIDGSDGNKFKIAASQSLGAGADIFIYDPTTGAVTINGFSASGSTAPVSVTAGDGITVVGPQISVNASVARTTTHIDTLTGSGLTGGGDLSATRSLSVLVPGGGGLQLLSTGIVINDSLAGTGLTMGAGKVLNLDTAAFVPPTRHIYTVGGLQGGGTLATDLTLSIDLASSEPGLAITDGLTVDGSVVRVTRQITTLAGTGLSGGGYLSADLGLSILLAAVNPGLSMASGLTVDATVVRTSRTLTAGAGLTGSGDLSANLTFAVGAGAGITVNADDVQIRLATASGLNTTSGLAVDSSLAGNGLSLSAGVLDVNVSNGLEIDSDLVRVNQGFTFAWTGAQTWAAGATFNGIPTFNSAPQVNANLAFIGADRTITASANLTVQPATNLTLDPTGGIVYLPDDVEERSSTFADLVTGINGFRLWTTGGTARQLTIGSIKADSFVTRTFVADTIRLEQGDSYWGKGYGIVNTDFVLPAVNADVNVWFDNVPNTAGNIFTVGDKLLARFVVWTAGVSVKLIWFNVQAFVSADDPNFRQRWTLRRLSGGVTGDTCTKGVAMEDAGATGQGWIHVTSLSGGPYMEFGTQTSLSGGIPQFTQNVRIGQLSGTVDYASSAWGFVTGNNLGIGPTAGFSGITIDNTVQGLRVFNAAYQLYNGANLILSLDKTNGLSIEYGSGAFNSIGWYDDLGTGTPAGLRGSVGLVKTGSNYSELDILSAGLASDAYTRGVVKLTAVNSSGPRYNVWVDDVAVRFGSGSGVASVTGGFITDAIQYLSGNVGIGTAAPDFLLDMQGTVDGDVRMRIGNKYYNVASTNDTASLEFSFWYANVSQLRTGAVIQAFKTDTWQFAGNQDAGLSFWTTGDGVGTQAMTIMPSGAVGIGTTGPGYPLDVQGNVDGDVRMRIANTYYNVASTDDTATLEFGFWANNAAALRQGAGIAAFKTGTWEFTSGRSAGLALSVSNAGTLTQALTILPSGFVGAGTTTPRTALDVAAGSLSFDANGTTNPNIIQGNFGATATWLFRSRTDAIILQAGSSDANVRTLHMRAGDTIYGLFMNTNGRVSIGSSTAGSSNLHVFGTTTLGGTVSATGLITATPGINFGGTTLADYAEGTWTPGLTVNNSATGVVIAARSGFWTRVGNRVDCWFNFSLSSKGAGAGTVRVTGLPVAANSAFVGASGFLFAGVNVAMGCMLGNVIASGTNMTLYASYGTSLATDPLAASQINNNFALSGSFTYFV